MKHTTGTMEEEDGGEDASFEKEKNCGSSFPAFLLSFSLFHINLITIPFTIIAMIII